MIIRFIFGIIFFTIAVAASLLLLGVLTVDRSLPEYEGQMEVPGLAQQLEIYRDSFGISIVDFAQKILRLILKLFEVRTDGDV